MFQSLFWWMMFWKNYTVGVYITPTKFQSLFWWMMFWKPEIDKLTAAGWVSFNPCFGG